MSALGVTLSSLAIAQAYQQVLDGQKDYFVLTYVKNSNDLRVQVCENGDLDYLREEFSDGRIQYAFARVKDPNTQLPKFVLINWCGEGVPENKKGLFASHSATVQGYLKGYHVSIQARSDADVEPQTIIKRISDSSGSKYGAADDPAKTQRGVPIAPGSSSYKPIGAPDIKGLQKAAKTKPDVIEPVGTSYTPALEELANIRATRAAASTSPLAPSSAPIVNPAKLDPPPAAPSTAVPVPAPATPAATTPILTAATSSKVDNDDKIKPVGTAYHPVRLAKPRKLGDRMAMFNQALAPTSDAAHPFRERVPSASGPGKLTWSQRQDQEKKKKEEEVRRSKDAIAAGPAPVVRGFANFGAPAAPASPRPPAAREPSPPPAPPGTAASIGAVAGRIAHRKLDEGTADALATPMAGKSAVALYDYEAAEDNEISLVEGQTITNIQQLDEGWWSGVTPDGKEGLFPCAYIQLNEANHDEHQAMPVTLHQPKPELEPATEIEPEATAPPPPPPPPPAPAALPAQPDVEEDVFPSPPPPPAPATASAAVEEAAPPPPPPAPLAAPAPHQRQSLVAVALYDYDAAEENEMSFAEGDRIVSVEFPSDEWWSGVNERTNSEGLFPANYTALQE